MDGLKSSLRIDPIAKADAARILERHHPLGAGHKIYSFALGIFWAGNVEGVMTWGVPAVNGAGHALRLRQSEILELRKLWVSDVPPRNTESRALAVAARIIRKRYPQIRLLITYCEGDERASAYKGAGWIQLARSEHAAFMTSPTGETVTIREFNRRGGKRILGRDWTPTRVSKVKWGLLLDSSLASLVQRQHAGLPARRRRFDSDRDASETQR